MANYVEQAEQVIPKLSKDKKGNISVKTNQIRKLLSAITTVNNQIELLRMQDKWDATHKMQMQAEIRYLVVKFAYQAGRDPSVKDLIQKAKLMEWLKESEANADKFKEFARYMEALVAFHKFYGGRD